MSVELDTTPSTPPPAGSTAPPVAAPTVEAPVAPAAPASEAPRLASADELWDSHQKDKAATGKDTAPPATPEKAPGSAPVAAPENNTATPPAPTAPTTPPAPDENDPVYLKAELAKERSKLQEIEQARQAAEVKQFTERQQAELNADAELAQKTSNAYSRKHAQVTKLEQAIAEARSNQDFEAVEELTAQYEDAFDEAIVIWDNKSKLERELAAKARYFQDQYTRSREGENQRALEQMLKPYGVDVKELLGKVPEQHKNNLFAVTDTALKTIVAARDTEIADLKKQLKETETRVRAELRDKWDSTNPGSVKHVDPGTGGAGLAPVRATDKTSDEWWEIHQRGKKAS
jgi:hypothetical protein